MKSSLSICSWLLASMVMSCVAITVPICSETQVHYVVSLPGTLWTEAGKSHSCNSAVESQKSANSGDTCPQQMLFGKTHPYIIQVDAHDNATQIDHCYQVPSECKNGRSNDTHNLVQYGAHPCRISKRSSQILNCVHNNDDKYCNGDTVLVACSGLYHLANQGLKGTMTDANFVLCARAGDSGQSYAIGELSADFASGNTKASSIARQSKKFCKINPPANGANGTCTGLIQGGSLCQFSCDLGYYPTGETTCKYSGEQVTARCIDGSGDVTEVPSWAIAVICAIGVLLCVAIAWSTYKQIGDAELTVRRRNKPSLQLDGDGEVGTF